MRFWNCLLPRFRSPAHRRRNIEAAIAAHIETFEPRILLSCQQFFDRGTGTLTIEGLAGTNAWEPRRVPHPMISSPITAIWIPTLTDYDDRLETEAKASRKYLYFAKQAEVEGFPDQA